MSQKSSIERRAARAFGLKNYPLAIRHLKDLLECVGENPHTLHMLALCHARRNEDLAALAFARRAIQADDRHLESLKLLARLHFLRGEHAEARSFVARALEQQRPRGGASARAQSWLSTIVTGLRRRHVGPHESTLVDNNEHRQWLEWAEAYMAQPLDPGNGNS
jgi:tetratricopeptide (TPR) repeat protein